RPKLGSRDPPKVHPGGCPLGQQEGSMQRPRGRVYPKRWAVLLLIAFLVALLVSALGAGLSSAAAPPADSVRLSPSVALPGTAPPLRMLWDQELLSIGSVATDIRWASDRTVYVSWLNGVRELALDGKFTRLRELIPSPAQHGPFGFDLLATSPDHIV